MRNPFSNHGNKLEDDDFIGRTRQLETIRERTGNPDGGGCVSIVGERRMGKTSLAHQALFRRREELLERHILPVWIDVNTLNEPLAFFKKLVRKIHDEISVLQQWNSVKLEKLYFDLHDAWESEWIDLQDYIEQYFEEIKKSGTRVVAVLDEFDSARTLFYGQRHLIHQIRSMANQSYIRWVAISRRSLKSIASRADEDISQLHNIFSEVFVSLFDEKEMKSFFEIFDSHGFPLTDGEKKLFQRYAGCQPYLLSLLGFSFFMAKNGSRETVLQELFQEHENRFFTHYNDIIDYYEKDLPHVLEQIVQILWGPNYNIRKQDISGLLKNGLIIKSGDSYEVFSQHFYEYFRQFRHKFVRKYWDTWCDTEQAVRQCLQKFLRFHYLETGDSDREWRPENDWLEALRKDKKNYDEMINGWQKRCEQERKNNPQASGNLLDYTDPMDFYHLMKIRWSAFERFLGSIKLWHENFELLNRVRRPFAHSREFTDNGVRTRADEICRSLLEMCEKISFENSSE